MLHMYMFVGSLTPASLTYALSSAQPCTTLFIANLGNMVQEEEMRDVFRSFPGFCRLRMHNKNGSPVAFAEFQVD
jgi:hypothetical protein